jgi:hypothetical protein
VNGSSGRESWVLLVGDRRAFADGGDVNDVVGDEGIISLLSLVSQGSWDSQTGKRALLGGLS